MLYNQNTIGSEIDRIGWSEAVLPSDIELDARNTDSVSGRYFNSFHQSAIVENVEATLPNPDKDMEVFNDLLYKMKTDSVLEVLNRIFDNNPLAYKSSQEINGRTVTSINYSIDGYDSLIFLNSSVMDDAIGYNMASRCLQLFITSTRSNRLEAIQSMNYSTLKVELDGYVNDNGRIITKGVRALYEDAIKRAIEILFPTRVDSNRATFRARHVW